MESNNSSLWQMLQATKQVPLPVKATGGNRPGGSEPIRGNQPTKPDKSVSFSGEGDRKSAPKKGWVHSGDTGNKDPGERLGAKGEEKVGPSDPNNGKGSDKKSVHHSKLRPVSLVQAKLIEPDISQVARLYDIGAVKVSNLRRLEDLKIIMPAHLHKNIQHFIDGMSITTDSKEESESEEEELINSSSHHADSE